MFASLVNIKKRLLEILLTLLGIHSVLKEADTGQHNEYFPRRTEHHGTIKGLPILYEEIISTKFNKIVAFSIIYIT